MNKIGQKVHPYGACILMREYYKLGHLIVIVDWKRKGSGY